MNRVKAYYMRRKSTKVALVVVEHLGRNREKSVKVEVLYVC